MGRTVPVDTEVALWRAACAGGRGEEPPLAAGPALPAPEVTAFLSCEVLRAQKDKRTKSQSNTNLMWFNDCVIE